MKSSTLVAWMVATGLCLLLVPGCKSPAGSSADAGSGKPAVAPKGTMLSPVSLKIASNLPGQLQIKAFISQKQPGGLGSEVARQLPALLKAYAAASRGKITVQVSDPTTDESVKKEARRLGVLVSKRPVITAHGKSSMEVACGVAFLHKDRVVKLPLLFQMHKLQYQVTSAISRASKPKPKIAFTVGHGEAELSHDLTLLREKLDDYSIATIDLSQEQPSIPTDIKVLVVAGPTERFSDRALLALDQHLMRGGSLVLSIDGVTTGTNGSTKRRTMSWPVWCPNEVAEGRPPTLKDVLLKTNDVGLAALLSHYGVSLSPDLIVDHAAKRSMRTKCLSPAVGIQNIARRSPITEHAYLLHLLYSSTVAIRDRAVGLKGTVLARSSENALRCAKPSRLSAKKPPAPCSQGSSGVGVHLTGSFQSYFADKSMETKDKLIEKSPKSSQLVVLGDSDFVRDAFLNKLASRFEDPKESRNLYFFENMIAWLSEDPKVATLWRTKPTGTQDPHSKSMKKIIKAKGGVAKLVKQMNEERRKEAKNRVYHLHVNMKGAPKGEREIWSGTVKNVSKQILRNVRVHVRTFASSEQTLTAGSARLTKAVLKPGESSRFEVIYDRPPRGTMSGVQISFRKPSGANLEYRWVK